MGPSIQLLTISRQFPRAFPILPDTRPTTLEKEISMPFLKWTLVLAFASTLQAAVGTFELPWMNHPTDPNAVYKSTDHKSAVFVLETWFLGCPYCNNNAPNVDALAAQYQGNSRVQVLDTGIDSSDSSYQEWIRRHHPNHPVLKDVMGKILVKKQLGTLTYPSTYVVDCSGQVLTKTVGEWDSSKKAQIVAAVEKGLMKECAEEEEGEAEELSGSCMTPEHG
jgi:hypothetical protein